jgi:hypothetical protein
MYLLILFTYIIYITYIWQQDLDSSFLFPWIKKTEIFADYLDK